MIAETLRPPAFNTKASNGGPSTFTDDLARQVGPPERGIDQCNPPAGSLTNGLASCEPRRRSLDLPACRAGWKTRQTNPCSICWPSPVRRGHQLDARDPWSWARSTVVVFFRLSTDQAPKARSGPVRREWALRRRMPLPQRTTTAQLSCAAARERRRCFEIGTACRNPDCSPHRNSVILVQSRVFWLWPALNLKRGLSHDLSRASKRTVYCPGARTAVASAPVALQIGMPLASATSQKMSPNDRRFRLAAGVKLTWHRLRFR